MSRRNSNYATIIYEESQVEGLQEILRDLHIPALVSPLHDRDELDDKSGYKKPHWHCLLMWSTLKSREQAQEVIAMIGGVGCESVQSQKAYAAYLIHLYDSDKAQYDASDVLEFSGANYRKIIKDENSKYTLIADVIKFCNENGIISFAELMEYSMKNIPTMFMALCDYPWPIIHYLKSKTWGYGNKTVKDDLKIQDTDMHSNSE